MNQWKIDSSRTDSPQGFPYAIVGPKSKIIAWFAEKDDARAIVDAQRKISGLAADSTRHRVLWLGSLAGRNRR